MTTATASLTIDDPPARPELAPRSASFDLEAELMDLAALADFLDVAAAGGDSQAHSAMLYAGRRLAEHRDALHRGFEEMVHAHHDELDDLRAKLAAAKERAEPGSAAAVARLEARRTMLEAAATVLLNEVKKAAP